MKDVETYINFLVSKDFKKKDIITTKFKVGRETIRKKEDDDYKYVYGDYVFYYSFKLEFDFNLDLMAQIIDETERLKDYPSYNINFGLKNDFAEELMTLAYKDAENKANIFARASGGKTIKCLEINLENDREYDFKCYNYRMKDDTDILLQSTIKDIFIPEDIELDFSLNSTWEIE